MTKAVQFQLPQAQLRPIKSEPRHSDNNLVPRGILKAPHRIQGNDHATRLEVPLGSLSSTQGRRRSPRSSPSTPSVVLCHPLPSPHSESWNQLENHYSPSRSTSKHAVSNPAIRIHSYLIDTKFGWNVAFPSSTATHSSRAPNLDVAATEPPLRHATLRFSHPDPHLSELKRSWEPLTIEASDSECITIRDILDAVHSYFQLPLRFQEYKYLPLETYHNLLESYTLRINPSQHHHHFGDPKRLDVLLGRTLFDGLKVLKSSSVAGGDVRFSITLGSH
ncbi:hypothetical protein K443DRAFT_676649 [Laccaria amethystina LaAM-08-1]|uniref:DUF6699 domain-containing protein n=1 Tax=Laccaria amethystina LaAM-08-1 TaxID=1095629 RepID=A0A0C9Y0W1_9AGAR|nr:hypothetical protein K443DRAFT_676649 [Laccaria amethystina LaAM-08-1]